MKNRFSSLDIMCMVKELQPLVGMRVNQIYDIDNKTYLIKLQIPEKKAVIIIESGIRFNSTTFDWPKNDFPSGFCMKLRKHLRNKRLESLKQIGKDRIVGLQFGSSDAAYHLFLELFDKGNIILTDHTLSIVNALRFHSEGDNKCVVRELYSLEAKRKFDNSDKNINEVLLNAKVGDPFRKLLMPFIDYGPACLEHILCSLGYEKGAKIKKVFTQDEIEKFVEGFYSALKSVDKVIIEPLKGYIFKKRETRSNGEEFFSNIEFHPYLFKQFLSEPFEEFENFNTAVDEFFSQMETQKIDMKALQDEKNALKKVEKIRNDQASRLKELDKKQHVDTMKAELITYNIDKVEEAILSMRAALAAQLPWNEIADLVEKAKSNPIGSLISKLKFETNTITLKLENPYADGEETSVLVDVDLDLSAYANAKKYYTNKKSASSKQMKTLQAQSIALKSAEKKVEAVLKDIQMTASITKSRLVFWFEKFFWFISSENYLVIGSRDKIQAELIIKKYMLTDDIFVHTDIPGSSCFVIKNPNSSPVPPKTLNEAGSMAVCFSSAWNVHVIANAWWVKGNQVVKLFPVSGADQFYRIEGQKNYLLPGQLTIGFGFIFYVDEESMHRHTGERQVRYKDGDNDNAAFSVEIEEPLEMNKQELSDEINALSLAESNSDGESDSNNSESEKNELKEIEKLSNTEHKSEEIRESDSNDSEFETNELEIEKLPNTLNKSEEIQMSKESKDNNANSETSEDEDGVSEMNIETPAETDLKLPDKVDGMKEKKGKSKNINENNKKSIGKQKEVSDNIIKRGQRSKLKKIKEKYKDQDEEEKQLRMAILQSAGSGKENNKKKLKQMKQQQVLEKKIKNIPKMRPKPQDNKVDEIEEPNIPIDTDLSMLDRLTGLPQPEDKIIFALPVVAPYSTLVVYKYRVKMTPGTSKRGKSAKSALNIFLSSKDSNEQEKLMMKSVSDQILCRDLPGKVKLSVGQAAIKLKKKK